MTWVARAIRSSEGVARLRSVTFSSSSMHNRDEIWVAKGRRRAGDGDGPDSPGRLTKDRTLQPEPHGKARSGPATSRKTALWPRRLRAPHGKPQFGWSEARRMRLSVRTRAQNALFRHVAAPGRCGATPRQAAGHYGECLNWANALEQPPARLRGGLRGGSQISAWSLVSRKSAF